MKKVRAILHRMQYAMSAQGEAANAVSISLNLQVLVNPACIAAMP
jgi:hypothetical protein